MNSWRDYPHLFANGEFTARSTFEYGRTGIDNFSKKDDKIIIGYRNKHFFFRFSTPAKKKIKDCTLIARRKVDMTKEEKMKCDGEFYRDPVYGFLYLLSIGVYPFDQKAFDTGEVIDIRELQ